MMMMMIAAATINTTTLRPCSHDCGCLLLRWMDCESLALEGRDDIVNRLSIWNKKQLITFTTNCACQECMTPPWLTTWNWRSSCGWLDHKSSCHRGCYIDSTSNALMLSPLLKFRKRPTWSGCFVMVHSILDAFKYLDLDRGVHGGCWKSRLARTNDTIAIETVKAPPFRI